MKVVQLNAVCSGSTGKICMAVNKLLAQANIDAYVLYANGPELDTSTLRYMSAKEIKIQALRSKILGNYGFNSGRATRRLIRLLDQIGPDVVHLHNMHGHNCHLQLLLDYLRKKKIRVFWTFHDCWTFTGYCTHFLVSGCHKWKNGCGNCSHHSPYSWFFDRSHALCERKRSLFSGLDLTIITPSQWLANLVKQSFLKDCPVKVINNGIDLSVFTPCPGHFRQKYGLEHKHIILGVADHWSAKKGLDAFIALSGELDDRFVCVLVGTDEKIDRYLPDNILSIHRTQNQQELAEIYSDADVFFNPTLEDTYPTVNMESIACGTPVITYPIGGSPEIVTEGTGFVVEQNMSDVIRTIHTILSQSVQMRACCIEAAQRFDQNNRFCEYVTLYTSEKSS